MAEEDYPKTYPMRRESVQVSLEDTVHYSINSAEGEAEWRTVYHVPYGFLYFPAQPSGELRQFGMAMFHQLHCVQIARA